MTFHPHKKESSELLSGNGKKLLPENDWITNPKVLLSIGVLIVVLCLLAMQLLCRSLSNVGTYLRGEPTQFLLLPSVDYMVWYLVAFLLGIIGAFITVYRIHTNFREMRKSTLCDF